MRIGIIVAMESEYALLEELLCSGGVKGHEVVLRRCGIGKVNAAIGATMMIEADKPDLVISTGVAGGIQLHTGDFVVGAQVAYHDVWCGPCNALGQVQGLPPVFEAPEELVQKAVDLGARSGMIASGDWFVDTPDKVAEIRNRLPEAIAVDMESGALAQTCFLEGVPFVSLRLISDDSDASAYTNFWETAASESFNMVRHFLESI